MKRLLIFMILGVLLGLTPMATSAIATIDCPSSRQKPWADLG